MKERPLSVSLPSMRPQAPGTLTSFTSQGGRSFS